MLLVILPFTPILVWFIADESWHPALTILYSLIGGGLLIRYARRVRSELAQLRGFGPADYAGTWQPGWPAAIYLKQLKALLQRRGWRVLGGEALGADRIMLMVHKDRFTAPVLLVRPGAAVTPQDLTQLAEGRKAAHAQRACLISQDKKDLPPAWAQAEQETAYLRYADLADLNDVLGFGD